MNCPACQADTIPFFKAYLKSGFGKHRCPQCGAVSRVKKSGLWLFFEVCLGLSVGGLWCVLILEGRPLAFPNWFIGFLGVLVALVLDIYVDSRLWSLELVPSKPT